MTRKDRPVAARQRALQPIPEGPSVTLAGVRAMCAGGKQFHCTISGYCRTRIFEFPRIDFRPDGEEPHHTIYALPPIQACVASDLLGYFTHSVSSEHYVISPSLRHVVAEIDEKIKLQQNGRVPVFVVVEEFNELTPVEMTKGECNISPEVVVQDGENVPMLTGGREGEEFITAWATIDGSWPELPNNEQLVNMILAGVRAGQQTPEPMRKYVDQSCLVTDDGQYVNMMQIKASVRASVATLMDTTAYRARVSEITNTIAALEQDIGAPHLALLVNSMYSDEYKDDAYQRLQYLGLWQSLAEAGRPCLDYKGSIRYDEVVVAGTKTLLELKEYRDDVAHWWTDAIDENFLADLRRTINELIRRKYF